MYQLIFESIGCFRDMFLQQEQLDSNANSSSDNANSYIPVAELSSDEWQDIITLVVDGMRDTYNTKLLYLPTHFPNFTKFFYNLHTQPEVCGTLCTDLSALCGVGQPELRLAVTEAAYTLGCALLYNRSTTLQKRATAVRQADACTAGERRDALLNVSSSLRRKAEFAMEHVQVTILQGVFVHRYRDANANIRAASIRSLGRYVRNVPAELLKSQWLKYLGWSLSDKCADVRYEAVRAIRYLTVLDDDNNKRNLDNDLEEDGNNNKNEGNKRKERQEQEEKRVEDLTPFVIKFCPRLVDMVTDISTKVSTEALHCLKCLLTLGCLDVMEDDALWEKVNVSAMDGALTEEGRVVALEFVLEQLEEFDEDQPEEDPHTHDSSNKHERENRCTQLDAIASWIAHTLTDTITTSPTQTHKIPYHKTDDIVHSLVNLSKYAHLLRDPHVVLNCIQRGNTAKLIDQGTASNAADAAKGPILIRMLCCTCREFHSSNEGGISISNANTLIPALPILLRQFTTDVQCITWLCEVPSLLPVESLYATSNQKHVRLLINALLQSLQIVIADEDALGAIGRCLALLLYAAKATTSSGRSSGSNHYSQHKAGLQAMLIESRRGLTFPSTAAVVDRLRHARRLHAMCKAFDLCDPSQHWFDDKEDKDSLGNGDLVECIEQCLEEILHDMQDPDHVDDESTTMQQPVNLTVEQCSLIKELLSILYVLLLWKHRLVMSDENIDSSHSDKSNEEAAEALIHLRDQLLDCSLQACRILHRSSATSLSSLAEDDDDPALPLHVRSLLLFLNKLHSDVRQLYPDTLASCESSLLNSLQLDKNRSMDLIRESTRIFRAFEYDLRALEDPNGHEHELHRINQNQTFKLETDLMLPLLRPLVQNWNSANRKEAGILLSHITGSGPACAAFLNSASRLVKKQNSVRFLEAHMACLRSVYGKWMDSEPMEPQSQRPTDAEMAAFEHAETRHEEQFEALLKLASKLSSTLGMSGKIKDSSMLNALMMFVKEGIRFAFLSDDDRNDGDDNENDLLLGGRLSFLKVMQKYSGLVVKQLNSALRKEIVSMVERKDKEIREHKRYEEVLEEDLDAIDEFLMALGVAKKKERRNRNSNATANQNQDSFTDEEQEDDITELRSNAAVTPISHASRSTFRSDITGEEGREEESLPSSMISRATSKNASAGESSMSSSELEADGRSSVGSSSVLAEDRRRSLRSSIASRSTAMRSSIASRSTAMRSSIASSVRTSISNLSPLPEGSGSEDDRSSGSPLPSSSKRDSYSIDDSRTYTSASTRGSSVTGKHQSQRTTQVTYDGRASMSTHTEQPLSSSSSKRDSYSTNDSRTYASTSTRGSSITGKRRSQRTTQITYDGRASMSTHEEASVESSSDAEEEDNSANIFDEVAADAANKRVRR